MGDKVGCISISNNQIFQRTAVGKKILTTKHKNEFLKISALFKWLRGRVLLLVTMQFLMVVNVFINSSKKYTKQWFDGVGEQPKSVSLEVSSNDEEKLCLSFLLSTPFHQREGPSLTKVS